jgi:hypothetical protein
MVRALLARGARPGDVFLHAVEGGNHGLAKGLLTPDVTLKQLDRADKRMETLLPDGELSALIAAARTAKRRKPRPCATFGGRVRPPACRCPAPS